MIYWKQWFTGYLSEATIYRWFIWSNDSLVIYCRQWFIGSGDFLEVKICRKWWFAKRDDLLQVVFSRVPPCEEAKRLLSIESNERRKKTLRAFFSDLWFSLFKINYKTRDSVAHGRCHYVMNMSGVCGIRVHYITSKKKKTVPEATLCGYRAIKSN